MFCLPQEVRVNPVRALTSRSAATAMIATTLCNSLSWLLVIHSVALIANTALGGQVCVIWSHLMSRRNVANSEPEFSHRFYSNISWKKTKRRMLVHYSQQRLTFIGISDCRISHTTNNVSVRMRWCRAKSESQVQTLRMEPVPIFISCECDRQN